MLCAETAPLKKKKKIFMAALCSIVINNPFTGTQRWVGGEAGYGTVYLYCEWKMWGVDEDMFISGFSQCVSFITSDEWVYSLML